MKISCESCGAQYDLDERRIPPSGMTMKCPACLHQFAVARPGASVPPLPPPSAAPPAREIALSPLEEEHAELPAPKAAVPKTIPSMPPTAVPTERSLTPPAPPDLIDLPAPVGRKPPPLPPLRAAPPDVIDLPAPRSASAPPPRLFEEAPDLPAPKRPGVGIGLDAPDPEDAAISLPPARSAPPTLEVGPPSIDLASLDLVAPKAAPVLDGPATRPNHRRPDSLELAPKGPSLEVAPKAPSLEVAPKIAPLEIESRKPVVSAAPKAEALDLAPKTEALDLAPKAEALDLAPKAEALDLAPRAEALGLAPRSATPRELDDATPVEAIKTEPKSAFVEEGVEKRRGNATRLIVAAAAAAVLVVGVGVGLGVFTSQGYFAINLWSGQKKAEEGALESARTLLADDTLASYREAARKLDAVTRADPEAVVPAALEAQAQLGAAQLGASGALTAAQALLERIGPAARKLDPVPPDYDKARALEALEEGKTADARTQLQAVLARAPADASALVYLGWTDLQDGDLEAAAATFKKAIASEPGRAAALYGAALAEEQLGRAKAASELYARALARSPHHFGAAIGAARWSTEGDPLARIETLITEHASSAGPKELAIAWTDAGELAAQAGRRDDAEDRLRRALKLDPSQARAEVALAGLQCDEKKCATAIELLRKIVAAQPKNLDARLALVRALLEGGAPKEAGPVLAPALASAPKDPRVVLSDGRVLALPGGAADREAALARFKQALAIDPHFIAAYLEESATLAALGRSDEAVAALAAARSNAAGDAHELRRLGEAYLELGKPADAASLFKDALAKKPDLWAAAIDLGEALEAQGQLDQAAAAYDSIGQKEPDYPGLAFHQARLAVKQRHLDLAWTLFGKALKQGIPSAALRGAAADLALETGRLDDALALGQAMVKDDDRSAHGHLVLAEVALAKHDRDEATIEARRAATLADLPEAHLALAQALEAQNKLDQAVAEYALARRPPVEGEARLGRARIMARMGASRDALAELVQLAKDPALRPRALVLLGDCYADLEQRDQAVRAYQDAVKASPEDGAVAFKLGRALLDLGRRKPGIDMIDHALKLGGDQAPYAANGWLLVGDAHREARESDAALRAYQKYLAIAPADAPARGEVQRQVSLLGGK